MIEEEEGDSDQVESEDSDQVEANVDVSPGKVSQDIAVVMVLTRDIVTKIHFAAQLELPRTQSDYRIAGDTPVKLLC